MILTQKHFINQTPQEERTQYVLTVFRKKYTCWLPNPLPKFKYLGVDFKDEICLCTTRPNLSEMFDVSKFAIGIGTAVNPKNRLRILEVPELKEL